MRRCRRVAPAPSSQRSAIARSAHQTDLDTDFLRNARFMSRERQRCDNDATLARRMAASVDVCARRYASRARARRTATSHLLPADKALVLACGAPTTRQHTARPTRRRTGVRREEDERAVRHDARKVENRLAQRRFVLAPVVSPRRDGDARATVSVSRVANDELSDVPSAPTRARTLSETADGRAQRARTGAVRDDAHKDLIAAAAVGRNDDAATRPRRPADDVRILETHVKRRRQLADGRRKRCRQRRRRRVGKRTSRTSRAAPACRW